jgi:hypothetical protein
MPENICPQISLTTHPGVELIIFSDGTNVTSDLDPDGNGCNLLATFSLIGISSPNVNQIDVALFDETSNRPLIQSPQGRMQSSITLNPSIENLPLNAAATLTVTFLSTIDGQPPRNVKLLIYACFSTTNVISPPSAASSPLVSLLTIGAISVTGNALCLAKSE